MPACHAGGHEFESRPHRIVPLMILPFAGSSPVRTAKPGSNPAPGFFVSVHHNLITKIIFHFLPITVHTWFSGAFAALNYALLLNRQWNKKQKHKKQPWGNVECFAFGGATVRFASLETSFHAANHIIPTPPSYEGSPHCPKDKNRSPFHGENPLMIK